MIIDFHTHIFPEKIASATVAALAKNASETAHTDGSFDGLVSALARAGVDISVNLPVLTRPTQFDSVKRFAEEVNERRGRENTPIISFAGAHPAMDSVEERMHELALSGFLGVKVHPDYQSTDFDDEGYVRIVKAAKRERLIVVTHAGVDAAYIGQPVRCNPTSVLRLLDRVGGYDKLVLAHYGGNRMANEVYDSLAGEDIYFDTAYILGSLDRASFVKILEKHGDDRILFASDSPWRDIAEDVSVIRSFMLGDESEEKIFSLNAKRLLKL